MALYYLSDFCCHINADLIPPAQYSNTPLFQFAMVFINGKANLVRPELVDQTFYARDMGLQSIR